MSISTHEAEASARLRSVSGRIAYFSRADQRGYRPEDLPKAREDHAEVVLELAIIRALREAPELSPERRARLAELLTAGDIK